MNDIQDAYEIENAIERGMVYTDGETQIGPRYAVIHKYYPEYEVRSGLTVKAGVKFSLIRTYAEPGGRWSRHTWNADDFLKLFKPLEEEK